MPFAVYPALMSGDSAAGYRADLVDFPGASINEANAGLLLQSARERLTRCLAELDQAGHDWPAPTAPEALSDRAGAEHAALLLVDIQVEDTPVRVNISIGDRLLRRLDETALAQNMSRSGFIAAAVRQKLGESPRGEGAQRVLDEVSDLGRRFNEALGPESAFGRTLADLDARALQGLRALSDRLSDPKRRTGDTQPPHNKGNDE